MKKLLLVLILFLTSFIASDAADPEIIRDTKGTDFWFTFTPNFHIAGVISRYDTLYIFITAEQPASGTIEWKNNRGVANSRQFRISAAGQVFTLPIHWSGNELIGWNYLSSLDSSVSQEERIAPQSFHITSDTEVTVYGLNQANTTSDAFIVLPTDVLGKEYVVVSYKSDGRIQQNGALDDNSTPSQFAVVATEDSTIVSITPKVRTVRGSLGPDTVYMKKGDVYLVQAEISRMSPFAADRRGDLTGSFIYSNKPIAVFGGHQRALLPVENGMLSSRDYLCEQILPLDAWGTSAFVVPFPEPSDDLGTGNDLYRVISLYDSTEIFVNGTFSRIMNLGEYWELPLVTPAVISSKSPIVVAQYKKTAQTTFSQTTRRGDPFMLLVPPAEQYLNKYTFVSAQGQQVPQDAMFPGDIEPSFQEHYSTLIIHKNGINNVRMDNRLLNPNIFQPIPFSDYMYAFVRVTQGSHRVTADSAFGLYAYGYGPANSYGYVGGMQLKIIPKDLRPPTLQIAPVCFGIDGMVFDTSRYDTGIRRVTALDTGTSNITFSTKTFVPFPDTVYFQARLTNIYQDGYFTVEMVDSVRFKSKKRYEIPGFTVALRSNQNSNIDTAFRNVFRANCHTFTLINYGKYPVDLSGVKLSSGAFLRVENEAQLKGSLAPGASQQVIICHDSLAVDQVLDTLIIFNDCIERKLLALNINMIIDRQPPLISKTIGQCGVRNVEVSDSSSRDWGVRSTTFTFLENLRPTLNLQTSNSRKKLITLELINPRKDGIYELRADDSSGNFTVIRDTVQGFTLYYYNAEAGKIFELPDVASGGFVCDSIEIRNYGIMPYKITSSPLSQNTNISVPLSSLPITVAPSSSIWLKFCGRSVGIAKILDTLRFSVGCEGDLIPLQLRPVAGNITGVTSCAGTELRLNSLGKPNGLYMNIPAPNPAQHEIEVKFGVGVDNSSLTMRIIDILGREVKQILWGTSNAGNFSILVPLENIPNGLYLIELRSENEYRASPFSVER